MGLDDRFTRSRKKKKQEQAQQNVYQQAAQSMQQAGLSGVGDISSTTQAGQQAVKDYYKEREKETGQQMPQHIQNIISQTPVEAVPEKKKEEVVPEKKKEQYDAVEDFWNEKLGTWDIRKARQNIPLLQQLTGRKIAQIRADGTIIFAEELGGQARFMKLADALNRLGSKYTGFDPTKALTEGGMGDQGKAALWNKLSDMGPEEFRDFLNRKGNLDRIMEFAGQGAAGGPSPDFDMNKLKSGGKEYLMGLLESTASGSVEDFQSLKDKNSSKKSDRERYWKNNPPRTQGDLEEAAMSGITWIEGYGPVERPEGQLSQGISGIGGGGGALPPTDPTTDPTKVPDYVLKQQYMPGFTPSYTGGPEQMQIAGGYWDPITKKWIGGGGPWGTQSQYQFPPNPNPVIGLNQGGIVGTSPLLFKNQGGMVNDNGIKAFKKYGY